MIFEINFNTKWSDFDPNRHMRHTAYNDYAAEVRSRFFASHGFSLTEFAKFNIGPILFSENTSFFREIVLLNFYLPCLPLYFVASSLK